MITKEMQAVLDDLSASDWLKQAIRSLVARDACDAVADAELLGALFRDRFEAMLGQGRRSWSSNPALIEPHWPSQRRPQE